MSEGVFKACQFLGLKFPSEVPANLSDQQEHMPSDYFGDDFELDSTMKEKLYIERKWTKKYFETVYENFTKRYNFQKCFRHTKTDLSVYFCDHVLFASKHNHTDATEYFSYEFYKKSRELQRSFVTQGYRNQITRICNDFCAIDLENDKSKTNKVLSDFLHRDWIYPRECTFEEFKAFVEKHPRFFSKPVAGMQGRGASIASVNSNENLDKLFDTLKNNNRILEEIVKQHETLSAFCPDTVNTIRIYTILDIHNVVHILATCGRFGRIGGVVDNVHVGGGASVAIDPKTGVIISDGLTNFHERIKRHPDTGKTFKGFQYPEWKKVCKVVKEMAKRIPQSRHIAWDIAVNDKGEPVPIEMNGRMPSVLLQQSADSVGRRYLYEPFLEEIKNYKKEQMKLLGWRVNNLSDFDSSYNTELRKDSSLKIAVSKLISDCASLMDLGCRKSKLVKAIISPNVLKYYPVDFQKHDDEVIACDFNDGEFPDIKADTCLCAFTAEYVESLPQFLANMCNAAQKQILMLCRPADKEFYSKYRWENPFLTDFTEEFLIKTMKQNNFNLNAQYSFSDNKSIFLYDFRR